MIKKSSLTLSRQSVVNFYFRHENVPFQVKRKICLRDVHDFFHRFGYEFYEDNACKAIDVFAAVVAFIRSMLLWSIGRFLLYL